MARIADVRGARRIAVVGSPGAGKSTLSRIIALRTGLPLVHLDKEHWRPGWVEPPDDEWRAAEDALIARERWVIDGNYGAGLARRAARADVIIWLDLPTGLCVWRVLKRVALARGRVRSDMGPGCPERLDWTFLHYVATFRRVQRPKTLERLAGRWDQVIQLRSRREVRAFAEAL
ncbi:adenylate kinase [Sphingomonas lenta]|uniref:Adenylate kinase n=1 Tax=Sphingomonas lenta TaxID=1141887 RepID=A0A2A2SH34_9SPHN|nr:adenylate kinase [Sphingomonas lenta]PAX08528.1 adenylate kinase [Sphingomonas lenta]